jgi:hypothetical protein
MDVRDDQRRERKAVMQQASREELVERIGRVVREDRGEEPLPGLHLAHNSMLLQPVHSVIEPSICVIAHFHNVPCPPEQIQFFFPKPTSPVHYYWVFPLPVKTKSQKNASHAFFWL